MMPHEIEYPFCRGLEDEMLRLFVLSSLLLLTFTAQAR